MIAHRGVPLAPQRAWKVPHEPAPRYVRHPPNIDRPTQRFYLPHVGPVRLEVDISDGPAQVLRNVIICDPCVLEHLAGQV